MTALFLLFAPPVRFFLPSISTVTLLASTIDSLRSFCFFSFFIMSLKEEVKLAMEASLPCGSGIVDAIDIVSAAVPPTAPPDAKPGESGYKKRNTIAF